jgi:S1-C subfamily serine protease
VVEIVPDSPAERAGIQPRDLILAVDGERMTGNDDLGLALSTYLPGDRVELTVRRGNRERDVQVRLARHPEGPRRPYLGLTYQMTPIN